MSGSLTPVGNGLIEWLAVGGSAYLASTDGANYAIGDTLIILNNNGTGGITAGKRIKFHLDENYYTPKYSVVDVSGAGLAASATTDATGYAIGATSVTLLAAGSGAALTGNVINFAGDTTNYTVIDGISSVAAGGTISFTPALVQAIPAAVTGLTCRNAITLSIGLQKEIVTTALTPRPIYTGGELKRPGIAGQVVTPTGAFQSAISDNVYLRWFLDGQVAQVSLDWGYTALRLKDDSKITRSIASSGVSQTRTIRSSELYELSIKFIDDTRTDDTTELEAVLSMFETWSTGVTMAWFPDYASRPSEFYYCTLDKWKDPRREGKMHWHGIDFTLRIESGTSVTIPSFGV